MSTYLLFSIQANYFQLETIISDSNSQISTLKSVSSFPFSDHPWWEAGNTWKSSLNNLRLIIQPLIFFCLIQPWFDQGFAKEGRWQTADGRRQTALAACTRMNSFVLNCLRNGANAPSSRSD